jgi:peptide deformylase
MKKVFVSALNNINYKKKFTETDPILKMRKIEVLINPEIELSTENEESEEECLSNLGVFFFIHHFYLY